MGIVLQYYDHDATIIGLSGALPVGEHTTALRSRSAIGPDTMAKGIGSCPASS